MGNISYPKPAKLFIGIIYENPDIKDRAVRELIKRYGNPDYTSGEILFNFTDYYRDIGTNLKREFFSFESLIDAATLPSIKIYTNTLEDSLKNDMPNLHNKRIRVINIDPGYLFLDKVVLATTKNFSHRPYLGNGIFADLTYTFKHGIYEHLPWTYPDYRSERYSEIFKTIRAIYKKGLQRCL